MTLQKHKVDNMKESDAHMVMSWLTDAIDSLEGDDIQKQDAPLAANEEFSAINQSTLATAGAGGLPSPTSEDALTTVAEEADVPIQASKDAQKSKSKTNLPPEMGRRDEDATVAMPFLRRKAEKEPDTESLEKAESVLALQKALLGIENIQAELEEAVFTDPSYIRKSFGISDAVALDDISDGTLLKRLLTDSKRPSEEWWTSAITLAKTIEGVTEPSAFAAFLYYYPDEFNAADFIEKTTGSDTSAGGVNISVLSYDTKNFDICPGAVSAFESVLACECDSVTDTQALIVKAAKETDRFLGMEKKFLDKGSVNTNEVEEMVRAIAAAHYMIGQLSEQLCTDFTDEFTFTAMHVANVLPLVDKGMDLDILEKTHHGVEKVDDLIYTENVDEDAVEDLEEDEKETLEEDRKDLESPAETGPMARAARRPNVIMREEIADDEETEYKRQPDTSGVGPSGDAGIPDNVSAAPMSGLGLSNDGGT